MPVNITLFSNRLFADDHVDMRSLEWALMQCDCLLIKRGSSDMAGMWVMPLQTKETKDCQQPPEAGRGSWNGWSLTALRRNQPCYYLDTPPSGLCYTVQPFLFLCTLPHPTPSCLAFFFKYKWLKHLYIYIFGCTKILVARYLVVPCEWTLSCRLWNLVPQPGIRSGPPALGEQSLSH